jgi:hypothetical protein
MWQYMKGWAMDREDGAPILVVTNSGDGGIAKPCKSWSNYLFEFETKIVHSNSAWIIRA